MARLTQTAQFPQIHQYSHVSITIAALDHTLGLKFGAEYFYLSDRYAICSDVPLELEVFANNNVLGSSLCKTDYAGICQSKLYNLYVTPA